MQWDNYDKFKTKVDRSYLLVEPTAPRGGQRAEAIPCWVMTAPGAGGVPILTCSAADRRGEFLVTADSGRVVWSMPPTGFLNLRDNTVVRVVRTPFRQYKLGMCSDNTKAVLPNDSRVDLTEVISSEGYMDLVRNSYPSFQEAAAQLSGSGVGSVAISPKSYLAKTRYGFVSLYVEGELVCWFYKGDIKMVVELSPCILENCTGVTFENLKEITSNVR